MFSSNMTTFVFDKDDQEVIVLLQQFNNNI